MLNAYVLVHQGHPLLEYVVDVTVLQGGEERGTAEKGKAKRLRSGPYYDPTSTSVYASSAYVLL
jgi:hypothetical protein